MIDASYRIPSLLAAGVGVAVGVGLQSVLIGAAVACGLLLLAGAWPSASRHG